MEKKLRAENGFAWEGDFATIVSRASKIPVKGPKEGVSEGWGREASEGRGGEFSDFTVEVTAVSTMDGVRKKRVGFRGLPVVASRDWGGG